MYLRHEPNPAYRLRHFSKPSSMSTEARVASRSFPDLPRAVRLQIYTLSGLIRPCPIDLINESQRLRRGQVMGDACSLLGNQYSCTYLEHRKNPVIWRHLHYNHDRPICFGPRIPLQLLLTCKEIYLEASELFYSLNKFKLQIERLQDLHTLEKLPNKAVSLIRSLHIHIGALSPPTIRTDASALSSSLQEFLDPWRRAMSALAQNLRPSQLQLGLTCRWIDLTTGEQLLQSLECLPSLRGCAITLGYKRDEAITSLVRRTSARLLRSPAPKASFPFEKLPKELRLNVLEQSDLVVREYPGASRGVVKIWESRKDRPRMQGTCCSRCSDCLETCCCTWRYGSSSTTCVCPSKPNSFFMVNRQFSQESQHVFFSNNLFVARPGFHGQPLPALSFLEILGPRQLAHIRYLELRPFFSDLREDLDKHQASRHRWLGLILIMKINFTLSKVQLTVDLEPANRHLLKIDPKEKPGILQLNKSFLMPLHELRSLGKLFIYLGNHFCGYEDEFEKAIMGSNYDPAQLGKMNRLVNGAGYYGPGF